MRRFRTALSRAIAPDIRVAVEDELEARSLVSPGALGDLAQAVRETSAAMQPMIIVAEEVPALRDGIAGFMNELQAHTKELVALREHVAQALAAATDAVEHGRTATRTAEAAVDGVSALES